MDKEEIKSLIFSYTYYRDIAYATGGSDTNHANYEHHQRVMKMCNDKIQELNDELSRCELLRRE